MRKFPLLGIGLLVPALGLAVVTTGCSNKGEAPKPTTASTTTPAPADKKGETPSGEKGGAGELIKAPTDGTIKGHVKFDGTAPKLVFNEAINKHNDKDQCLKGNEFEKSEQQWLVNSKDNGVANVLVYLQPVGKGKFDVTSAQKKHFEKPAVLDQPHCAFVPHVLAMYPDAGQILEVKNSAPVPHNTKLTGDPLKNPGLPDKNLPPGSEEKVPLKYQGREPVSAVCSQHPWMNAKIFTFNQPYFAVTNGDGAFEIHNVPTGVEVKVMMWHESMGNTLKDATEVDKRSFKAGDNEVNLKIAKK